MIVYNESFDRAIVELRKTLLEYQFDLVVRELKLPGYYFRQPGLVYYGHSFANRLKSFGCNVELLVKLFCLVEPVLRRSLEEIVSPSVVSDLLKLGLLIEEADQIATDQYCIVPYLGNYIISTLGTARSAAAFIGGQSYLLAPQIFSHPFESFLDLGSGSGLFAILAASRAQKVVGVDIVSEAVDVSRTNAVLNQVAGKVEFRCGDMYTPVKGESFDTIVANAPFAALPEKYSSLVTVSSGEDGLGFIRKLIDGMFDHSPKMVKIVANGLGSETTPLLMNFLKNRPLTARGYQAKLLIYSKGLIDEPFISGAVKLVEGSYKDRGESIDREEIVAQLKDLYKRLRVDYYYGILLELEKTEERAAKNKIEMIDMSNRYNLNSAPSFKSPITLQKQDCYTLKLDQTSLPISSTEREIVEILKQGGRPEQQVLERNETVDFFIRLEKVFGAGKA